MGKEFGDVRIPNAMGTPRPAARILGGRRGFVLVKAREIHPPEITLLWGQGPSICCRQGAKAGPR